MRAELTKRDTIECQIVAIFNFYSIFSWNILEPLSQIWKQKCAFLRIYPVKNLSCQCYKPNILFLSQIYSIFIWFTINIGTICCESQLFATVAKNIVTSERIKNIAGALIRGKKSRRSRILSSNRMQGVVTRSSFVATSNVARNIFTSASAHFLSRISTTTGDRRKSCHIRRSFLVILLPLAPFRRHHLQSGFHVRDVLSSQTANFWTIL